MTDKRRTHRLRIQLPARFKLNNKLSFSDAFTLNISAKGLCFNTREQPKIGEEFLLQVELPDKDKALINTIVIWVRETDMVGSYDIGVKISEEMQYDEAKFVRYYAQKLLDMDHEIVP